MKWISLLSLCATTQVWAQAPAAAPVPAAAPAAVAAPRAKATRATGPSLAAGRDDDFTDAASAAGSDTVPEADDPTLLRAVLWAFEPAPREIRVQAVEDLGLLGDARLLNALAHFVVDPDLPVQVASVRAVRLIRSPRSEEILINVVKHPTMPDRLKLLALEGLLFQNTRTSLVFLWNVANNPNWGPGLYGTARRLLLDVPKDAWGKAT